jgi:hypothetical protein
LRAQPTSRLPGDRRYHIGVSLHFSTDHFSDFANFFFDSTCHIPRNEFFPHDKDTLEQQVRIVHRHVIDWADPKWIGKQQYRETPVIFANGNEGADWRFIPRLMTQLCESDLLWTDPEAFVIELLSIHPFEDGNGRTAAIILNRRSPGYRELPEVEGWVQHA